MVTCFITFDDLSGHSYPFAILMFLNFLRTALKDDLHCTAAELVYEATLHLPGKFFVQTNPDASLEDPTSYVTRLKSTMQQLQAPPVHSSSQYTVFVHKDLCNSTHVFLIKARCKSIHHYSLHMMAPSKWLRDKIDIKRNGKLKRSLIRLID